MTVPTQPVTINLADFGGDAVDGVVVTARLSGVDYTADGIFVNTVPVTGTTVAGVVVLELFPNAVAPDGLGTLGTTVRVTARMSGSKRLDVEAMIPNRPCNLAQELVPSGAVPLTEAQLALLAARTALANAEAVVAAAASLLGTSQFATYAAHRLYTGTSQSTFVTGYLATAAPAGIAGAFVRDDFDTTSGAMCTGSIAPIAAPIAPSLGSNAGGALAATTYYVRTTYVTAAGETVVSPEASIAVAVNRVLVVTTPAAADGVTGWNVYVGTSAGTGTKRNTTANAIGANWTQPTTGLPTGWGPPPAAGSAGSTLTVSAVSSGSLTDQLEVSPASTGIGLGRIADQFSGAAGGVGKYTLYTSVTLASAALLVDNGGTCLVAANGKRWKRVYTGDMIADWFSVSATDAQWAIQAAIEAAPAFSSVGLSASQYTIGNTIVGKDNVTLDLKWTKITARAGTSFEYMVLATGKTGWHVINGTLDANKANRESVQGIRFMGGGLITCVESSFRFINARNCLGFNSIPAVAMAIGGGSSKCKFATCHAQDCGDESGTKGSDAFFMSGDNNIGNACTAENCTDTAFACESSNNSGYIGCSMKHCSVLGAISNATNVDKRGNFLNGLSGIDWKAGVTGGIQVAAYQAGHLLDCVINSVSLTAPDPLRGIGPGINIRKPFETSTGDAVTTVFAYTTPISDSAYLEVLVNGVVKTLGVDYTLSGVGSSSGGNVTFTVAPAAAATVVRRTVGKVNGLVINGGNINQTTTQGVVVDGINVRIMGLDIKNTGAAAVQFQDTSTGAVSACSLNSSVSFGVVAQGNARVKVMGGLIETTSIGAYALGSSTMTLVGVDIANGTTCAAAAGTARLTVDGCNISGYTTTGVLGSDTTTVKVVGGTITTSTGGAYASAIGVRGADSASVTIIGTDINGGGTSIAANNTSTVFAYVANTVASTTIRYAKDVGANLNCGGYLANTPMVNNSSAGAPAGAPTAKYQVFDRAGNNLGFAPLYN